MAVNPQEILPSLLSELDCLQYGDENCRDALMKRALMIIGRITGAQSNYVSTLKRIQFYPMWSPSTPDDKHRTWISAAGQLRNLVNTLLEEIQLFGTNQNQPAEKAGTKPDAQSLVFIVHGHDEELKQAVARTVEKLGLVPVILHEKPNQGRTIIEKFTDYSQVGFAVVLLSADDICQSEAGGEVSYRARQNVILELGFFLGRLGREKVAAIFKPHEAFEMPSDYSGVLFVEYDVEGVWRFKLAKELKECGFKINVDDIL